MEMQSTVIESVSKLEVIILCPGLSGDDISVAFDKKEGVLDINGTPKEGLFADNLDLTVSGKLQIPPKYRSDKISFTVTNGIALVQFGVSKDVKIIKATS